MTVERYSTFDHQTPSWWGKEWSGVYSQQTYSKLKKINKKITVGDISFDVEISMLHNKCTAFNILGAQLSFLSEFAQEIECKDFYFSECLLSKTHYLTINHMPPLSFISYKLQSEVGTQPMKCLFFHSHDY